MNEPVDYSLGAEKPFREVESSGKCPLGLPARGCHPMLQPDLGCPCRFGELPVTIICCVQVSRRPW